MPGTTSNDSGGLNTGQDCHQGAVTFSARQLLDNLPDLIFVLSREAVILDANNHPDLLVPRDTIIGLPLTAVLPEGIAGPATEAVEAVFASGTPQHFEYALTFAAEPRFFSATLSLLTPDTVTAVCRETTAEQQLRKQLAEQRDFLERIYASDVVAMTVLNDRGELIYANAQAEKVLGLAVKQREDGQLNYNDPIWSIEHPDGGAFPEEDLPFARVRRTGLPVSDVRHAIVWPDGTRKVLSINGAPLPTGDFNDQSYVFAIRDVTREKADDERVRESERRLASVIYGTRIGTWEWNVQTGETVFNQRWAEMVGYRLEELAPISIDTWTGLAHPDDFAESERLLNQHFSGETDVYDCKARMRHKAGHWIWVHDRGRVVEWTPAGEPLMMFGTHADITQEVEAQQALQASRDELASLVANMPGVTYRCLPDENWTMLFMSHHVDQVSGYKAEDLIGNKRISYAELIHPEDAPAVTAKVERAIAAGHSWHIRYRIHHLNGNWRWVEERGRSIEGDTDHPILLEGFLVDITREQEVEAQLAKHHDALALLNGIAFNAQGDMTARISDALKKACVFLEMEVGIVSQIEGQVYSVGWVAGPPELPIQPGDTFKLGQTWCQLLAAKQHAELFLFDIPDSQYHSHPCRQHFPLGAYGGIAIEVEGQLFGTLNFSSSSPRTTQFDESEVMFVRLLARWVAGILESNFSNERMAKLLAQLPGMVFQYRAYPDGQNTFPFSSPQIQPIYGMTPDEAAVDATPAFEQIHPEDISAVRDSIERSRTGLENWNATYRTHTTHQGYRWVTGQARPERLSDGSTLWHGYIQDIHEKEQARKALERNESRLRGLFEFSPIGIALNDVETGQFLDLNDALLAPTGYSREEFVRLSYWEVTPIEYQQEEEKALADLKTKGRYGPFEKEYIRKDGSRYPVRLQGMLSQDADGRAVIWSLIEDISERNRVERMKREFISTVSHELRTPLTSISGALRLVTSGVSGELPDSAMKVLDIAQRNSQRLGLLINDLLDMEKLVAGKMELHMAVQPLMDIIRTAIADNQAFADRFSVALELIEPEQNPRVKVDAARLEQVMANLLSNGAKFSPEGESVKTEIRIKHDQVKVTVKDRGPGIPESFKPRLFEKFSQADASDRRSKSGTGLGLAISKELMEQMGGSIGVCSIEGQGSEFYIELPLVVYDINS